MNLYRRPALVAIGGVFCFCLGVWLRFHAVAVATASIRSGLQFEHMEATLADGARANAIYEVATPLLWVGGALVVLAAAVYLLPLWPERFAPGRRPTPASEV